MSELQRTRPQAPLLLRAVALCGFVLLYIPLVLLLFQSVRILNPLGGYLWTLDGYRKVFQNIEVIEAAVRSGVVALGTSVLATTIGTLASVALVRSEFFGKRWLERLSALTLGMPEIVLGLSLLIWFVVLHITLGMLSLVIAHTTFSLSYVILTVSARLKTLPLSLEEAARDLGANAWTSFWRVTFPMLLPAIIAGALMSFTLSFDDFVVSFFTAGAGTDTLPLKIYSMVRYQSGPEINALASLTFGVTVALVLVVASILQKMRHNTTT
jgi:spermidine/putrescine transport system permease protein